MFENPFSKKDASDETINDTFSHLERLEEKEEETTAEQDIATIEEKKQEVEKLRNKLESYKNYAFQLREKILRLGLSEKKKREIYAKITDRSKEIANTINEIKEVYGIEPTEIEVLSSRFASLTTRINQMKESLQLQLKALQEDLEKFSQVVRSGSEYYDPYVITDSLKVNHIDIPVVSELVEALASHSVDDTESLADLLEKYAKEVSQKRDDLVPYESPGEEDLALEKLERLRYLADITELRLREAKENPDTFR
ncbi:MAG: hypothetical protein WD552_00075 [Candidatus Paceibacterota bacterium]